jgi:hypothetical protein
MKLLLSGEGASDLGICTNSLGRCDGSEWRPGAMAVLLVRLLETWLGYDLLDTLDAIHNISETALCAATKELPTRLQPARGKKRGAEIGYYYGNAKTLALEATKLAETSSDSVLAVFFRDSDGTASAKASTWSDKWKSICDGFANVDFKHGVPMLPRPKSEAWLMAITTPGLKDCRGFEELPGNDESPNSAKSRLSILRPDLLSAADWCDWLQSCAALDDGEMQRLRTMGSFDAFYGLCCTTRPPSATRRGDGRLAG